MVTVNMIDTSRKSLPERQESLDRAIELCGFKLDSSEICLRRVMEVIGASTSEISFVKQCIELRLRTTTLLDKADAFISETETMLDLFETEEEEWRRKGHALGFNL